MSFQAMSKSILVFVLIALSWTACKERVEEIKPSLEKISESVYASGRIKSRNQYQVYSTVGGLLQRILVKENDLVKKGDPLFVVQNETSRLNAENALLSAEYANSNVRGERLQDLETAIETARSKLLNDSLLLIRQRGLWSQQIGSKVELEQRELAFTASKNNLESALLRYKDLQKQLGFNAAQSRKQLAISKNLEQDYIIRAQTAGRVYSIDKEAGEIVNQQAPLAVIGGDADFLVEMQVDENDIVRIKDGMLVLITMDSYKGQVFEAKISKIDPLMNQRTRTFTVEAEFVKAPPVLYPNLSTEANIVVQTREQVLTIPRAFLVNDSMVFVSKKGLRPIKTGLKDYLKVEIISGLQSDETIQKPVK